MKLDNIWQIPNGFEAVKNYQNTKEGETVVGVLSCKGIGSEMDLQFDVGEDPVIIPTLPWRERGLFWSSGWDIPTRWVIDGIGLCWMDNAHGHPLVLVEASSLVQECENDQEKRRLQKLLGVPVDRPKWVLMALEYGWTPQKAGRTLDAPHNQNASSKTSRMIKIKGSTWIQIEYV